MAKKNINARCPLQEECGRKCENFNTELKCDYYRNNAVGDKVIPDQERLREEIMALVDHDADEEFMDNLVLDDEDENGLKRGNLVYISVDDIFPHPDNPRKELGDLEELANSIKANGVMQNLTVVPFVSKVNPKFNGAGRYTVIIGHRRLAAAKLAGLTEVPCVIADMTLQEQVSTMLLENMQRSDLTVYEQAQGFQMMFDFGESVESISEKTGFSKSTVRRRLKMAELDQKVLKEVSERQLSLLDFDRLYEIKDVKARNSVLATMGTNNFEGELNRAIAAQKATEKKQEWLDALAEKGVKEIPESEVFATKYERVAQYRFDLNEPARLDDDIEEGVEYFYAIAYSNWIYISKHKVITAEDEAEAAEQERIKAEQRARREALEDAATRAYECRKRFIKATSNATAKKFIKEIISYTISHAWTPGIYGSFDRELYAEQMGVEIPAGTLNYGLVQFETENAPEYSLLCYAYALWNDNASNDYYDYQMMHCINIKLNALYSLLKKLGYQMSDEEIALRDGTSDLFVKPEAVEEEEFNEDAEPEITEDTAGPTDDEMSTDELLDKLNEKYGDGE